MPTIFIITLGICFFVLIIFSFTSYLLYFSADAKISPNLDRFITTSYLVFGLLFLEAAILYAPLAAVCFWAAFFSLWFYTGLNWINHP